jgi:ABC-2 type transport system permease protein
MFFPFTAPLTAILRMSLSALPAWQLIVSLLIMTVSAVVVIWAAARVFRWASLLYGKRATPREIWRVIRGANANQIGTVMTTQEEPSA